jgi:predicted  nucleic acid-binding Zn-ribbon protein
MQTTNTAVGHSVALAYPAGAGSLRDDERIERIVEVSEPEPLKRWSWAPLIVGALLLALGLLILGWTLWSLQHQRGMTRAAEQQSLEARSQLAAKTTELDALKAQIRDKDAQISRLEADLKIQRDGRASAERELAELRKQREDIQKTIEERDRAIAERDAARAINQEVATAKSALEERVSVLQKSLDDALARITELEGRLTQATNEREELRDMLRVAQARPATATTSASAAASATTPQSAPASVSMTALVAPIDTSAARQRDALAQPDATALATPATPRTELRNDDKGNVDVVLTSALNGARYANVAPASPAGTMQMPTESTPPAAQAATSSAEAPSPDGSTLAPADSRTVLLLPATVPGTGDDQLTRQVNELTISRDELHRRAAILEDEVARLQRAGKTAPGAAPGKISPSEKVRPTSVGLNHAQREIGFLGFIPDVLGNVIVGIGEGVDSVVNGRHYVPREMLSGH